MCGIVYYKSFDHTKVNRQVLRQYKRQRSRGSDGFGFYLPKQDRMTHAPQEHRIKRLLRRSPDTEILFHHRFPTSTDNVRNACHPFSTKDVFGDTQYIMVHNGWLTNAGRLKLDHEALGIRYVSEQTNGQFNDSEALMYDLALTLQGRQKSPIAIGPAAWIMIERFKGEAIKLHFGRNTNPLKMVLNNKNLTLSSEGDGVSINPDTHYTYTYATGEITQTPLVIDDSFGYTYQNYKHGYTTSKGYQWEDDEGWAKLKPKTKITEQVFSHGIDTGDVVSTASDLLMESNLDYAEAGRYAQQLINKYSTKLVVSISEGEMMSDPSELKENQYEQLDFSVRLEHWTEVKLALEEWEQQEIDYKKESKLALEATVV